MKNQSNFSFEHDDDFEDYYDKGDVFADEIAPKMEELMETCRKHRLPIIMFVSYAHSEVGSEGDGFACVGGIAGSVHHMPVPMLVSAALMEERVEEILKDSRRQFVQATLIGDLQDAEHAEAASLWRQAVAAQVVEDSSPKKADKRLHKQVEFMADVFTGLTGDGSEDSIIGGSFNSGIERGEDN